MLLVFCAGPNMLYLIVRHDHDCVILLEEKEKKKIECFVRSLAKVEIKKSYRRVLSFVFIPKSEPLHF